MNDIASKPRYEVDSFPGQTWSPTPFHLIWDTVEGAQVRRPDGKVQVWLTRESAEAKAVALNLSQSKLDSPTSQA